MSLDHTLIDPNRSAIAMYMVQIYLQTSNMSHTLVGNKIVGTAPTTSSFLT